MKAKVRTIVAALAVCSTLGDPATALELSAVGGTAVSQDLTPEVFGPVSIVIEDNAVGRCWTNVKQARHFAEAGLQALGYVIRDDAVGQLQINVAASREQGGGCFGTIDMRMRNVSFGSGMDFVERFYAIVEERALENLNEHVVAAISVLLDDMKAAAEAQ
jgi:hypothetical protein